MNCDIRNRTAFGIVLFLTLSLAIFLINPVNADVESPKKQYKRGIPAEDITCKTGLSLVIRTNGFAACVKSTTADKLEKMGLITKIIKLEKYVSKDSEK